MFSFATQKKFKIIAYHIWYPVDALWLETAAGEMQEQISIEFFLL